MSAAISTMDGRPERGTDVVRQYVDCRNSRNHSRSITQNCPEVPPQLRLAGLFHAVTTRGFGPVEKFIRSGDYVHSHPTRNAPNCHNTQTDGDAVCYR